MLTRPILTALFVTLLSLCASVEALAEGQEGGQGEDRLSAQAQALLVADLKLGPFLLQPGLTIGGGWRSTREPIPGDLVETRPDFVATIAPEIRTLLPITEKNQVRVQGGGTYEWFYRFEGLRTINYGVLADYEFSGNRVTFTVSDDFRNRERGAYDPLEPGDVIPGPGLEADRRLRYLTNIVTVSTDVDTSSRTRVGLELSARRLAYDQDERELAFAANSITYAVQPSFAYHLSSTVSLTTDYEIETLRPDRPGNIREATIQTLRGGAEWTATGPMSGSVSAGYSKPITVAEGGTAYQGFVIEGAMSVRFNEKIETSFSISREPLLSARIDTPFFLRSGAFAQLDLTLSSALSLGMGGSYYTHEYPQPVGLPELEVNTQPSERVAYYFGTAQWLMTERGTFTASVGYRERTADESFRSNAGYVINIGYSFVY